MLGALFPIVLAIHVIITVFLIGIILTQKNEGGMGGLGGGASGGMAGFLSGRQPFHDPRGIHLERRQRLAQFVMQLARRAPAFGLHGVIGRPG